MDRINGADWIDLGGARRGFRDENLPVGLVGTEVTARWLNAIQEELAVIIEGSGLVLSEVDWSQLGKALQRGKLVYAIAGGTAADLTAALAPTPSTLTAGMVVRILAAHTNSGPATLDLNGLGAAPILLGGSALQGGEILAGTISELMYTGTAWQLAAPPQRRVVVPLTLYVSPDTGSDGNDGLTAGTPFQTLQRAVNSVSRMFLEDASVTIQCAPSLNYKKVKLRQFSGAGSVSIVGDRATPGNCRLTDVGNCVSNTGVTGYTFAGFRLQSSTTPGELSTCFAVVGGALSVADIEYGPVANHHCYASDAGQLNISHGHKILGVAPQHIYARHNAVVRTSVGNPPALDVSVSGAFAQFARADLGAILDAGTLAITGAGTLTGVRAHAATNGVIFTAGGGANFFPGDVAPVTATGGQYA